MTFDDLKRLLESMPKDPVRPSLRRTHRLWATDIVPRGQVYRLANAEIVGMFDDQKPLIVMHAADVELCRLVFASAPMVLDVDQEIADCCAELFKQREESK